jgi:hypothetical protein
MSEPLFSTPAPVTTIAPQTVPLAERVTLDSRHPQLLDHHGYMLQVAAGHVDLFAVSAPDSKAETSRRHLFRVERGEIIPDLFDPGALPHVQVIAVGGDGAEVLVRRRDEYDDHALIAPVEAWIAKLSKAIAGPNPSWDIPEVTTLSPVEMKPGERRRGPARNVVWMTVRTGVAQLMDQQPAYRNDGPPVALASGMWIAAQSSCTLGGTARPTGRALWEALDHFHRCALGCIEDWLKRGTETERERLVRRRELTNSRAVELFDRLSALIVRRPHARKLCPTSRTS